MGNATAIKVARVFINGQSLTTSTYQSTGTQFTVFGNVVAEKCEGGFFIRDCGWCTASTAQALNALPGVRLRRLKGECIWNEKCIWDGTSKFIEYNN